MTRRALIFLGAIAALGGADPSVLSAKVVERIIARVNNEIITKRMFEREQQKLRERLAQDYSGAELEGQIREQSKNLLRDLIDQSLLVQKSKDLNVNVETDVIKRLDEIRKGANLASLEDLQGEAEKRGMHWEDFKDGIRRNLLMREVIGREVDSRIIISRGDARKYYEEHKSTFQSPGGVHLVEILIKTEKRSPEEAEKRAKEALAELKAGQRWVEVVKKYSEGSTANEGGDLGLFKPGTLAPTIEEAVAKLDPGDYTDVIQTKYGYQIIRVQERFSPGIASFEQIEQRVYEFLHNQKLEPALRQYLTTLRKQSYIFLAPGFVDAGAERASETVLAQKSEE